MKKERVARLVEEKKVVTMMDPSQIGIVGIQLQGDLELYTAENIKKRKNLRYSPRVVQMLRLFWRSIPEAVHSGEISKSTYASFIMKWKQLLCFRDNEEEFDARLQDKKVQAAYEASEMDWNEDTRGGFLKMTEDTFFDSLFDVADTWTEEIDEITYAAFLWRLLRLCFDLKDIAFNEEMDFLTASRMKSRPFRKSLIMNASPQLIENDTSLMLMDYHRIFSNEEHLSIQNSELELSSDQKHDNLSSDQKPSSFLNYPEKEYSSQKPSSFLNYPEKEYSSIDRIEKSSSYLPEVRSSNNRDKILKRHSKNDAFLPSVAVGKRKKSLGYELMAYLECKGVMDAKNVKKQAEVCGSIRNHGAGYIPQTPKQNSRGIRRCKTEISLSFLDEDSPESSKKNMGDADESAATKSNGLQYGTRRHHEDNDSPILSPVSGYIPQILKQNSRRRRRYTDTISAFLEEDSPESSKKNIWDADESAANRRHDHHGLIEPHEESIISAKQYYADVLKASPKSYGTAGLKAQEMDDDSLISSLDWHAENPSTYRHDPQKVFPEMKTCMSSQSETIFQSKISHSASRIHPYDISEARDRHMSIAAQSSQRKERSSTSKPEFPHRLKTINTSTLEYHRR